MSKAIDDVLAERKRQVESEGWNVAHDDAHTDGSLASAAACYALTRNPQPMQRRSQVEDISGGRGDCPLWETVHYKVPKLWPESWHPVWWKPKTRRQDLIRAAALIIAEIERLDRSQHETPR